MLSKYELERDSKWVRAKLCNLPDATPELREQQLYGFNQGYKRGLEYAAELLQQEHSKAKKDHSFFNMARNIILRYIGS